MMILTKNQLSLALACSLLLLTGAAASAHEPFNCVRDLLPITGPAAFQVKRAGVEKPFAIAEKYIVFPEVKEGRLTGFYIYSGQKAKYYDSYEGRLLTSLKEEDLTVYELIAQPDGLETVSIKYLPGYRAGESTQAGPVVLGSSILPVMGAVVSRDNLNIKSVYHDPSGVSEEELRHWIYQRMANPPASAREVKINRKLLHLGMLQGKSKTDLWEPLQTEFKARKNWVQTHNLDENAFRQLARLMSTSCRQ